MSGIVGIFERDGKPVDREVLRALTDFLSYRGPDGLKTLSEGALCFGHTMLRTTRESLEEHQPACLDGRLWIVADARIDCRADLIGKLEDAGRLGGGSVAGAPTIGGGVTGSLGSGLTFTDSDPSGMNYYVSGTFTPGNTLSFDLAMTSFADSNTSASGFAGDEFLVFILDAGGTDFVTTTDGSTPDTFLLGTVEGQNGLNLQGNNIPGAAATTIVSSATATPEPGTFVLLAAGILMFAFRRRCFAIN